MGGLFEEKEGEKFSSRIFGTLQQKETDVSFPMVSELVLDAFVEKLVREGSRGSRCMLWMSS